MPANLAARTAFFTNDCSRDTNKRFIRKQKYLGTGVADTSAITARLSGDG